MHIPSFYKDHISSSYVEMGIQPNSSLWDYWTELRKHWCQTTKTSQQQFNLWVQFH